MGQSKRTSWPICKKTDMWAAAYTRCGDALALLKKQGSMMLSMIAQIAGAAYAMVFGQILAAAITEIAGRRKSGRPCSMQSPYFALLIFLF